MFSKLPDKKVLGSNIKGFIFGGFSSRFWILKNDINLAKEKDIDDSMLCWNMISVELHNPSKCMDLIITCPHDMDNFISYLLDQMRANDKVEQRK